MGKQLKCKKLVYFLPYINPLLLVLTIKIHATKVAIAIDLIVSSTLQQRAAICWVPKSIRHI